MKNYIIILSLFLCASHIGFSQVKTPEFQFTLYAHDSLGHKDSVIIGYDLNAATLTFDTSYGGKSLKGTPFDTVFDVRMFTLEAKTSTKKLIVPRIGDCNPYGKSSVIARIAYTLKYPPIVFSWDKTLFTTLKGNNICGADAFLVYAYETVQTPAEYDPNTIFFNQQDSITIGVNAHDSYKRGLPIDGKIQVLYDYDLKFQQYTRLVGTEDMVSSQNISSYPNPVSDRLNILLPTEESANGESVQIINAAGQKATTSYSRFGNLIALETDLLPAGFYMVEIITKEKHRYVSKFLKE